jgi:uncharacterized membrane protein
MSVSLRAENFRLRESVAGGHIVSARRSPCRAGRHPCFALREVFCAENIVTLANRACSDRPWRNRLSPTGETKGEEPLRSALVAAHIVYGLHTVAIVLGIMGSATVIGGFVGSVPSLIAVIINYLKRSAARGSWAASHYRWQIRTFWFALLWLLVAVLLVATVVGAPFGLGLLIALTLWLIYRIARGWLRLLDKQPMYV